MKITKDSIRELRNTNPNMQAIVIARQLGVSRERVRQLLVKLNLPTKFQQHFQCSKCGKKLRCNSRKPSKLCWVCYIEDYHKHHTTKLVCPHCNKQFTRKNSYIERESRLGQKLYCSYSCRALSMWETRKKEVKND